MPLAIAVVCYIRVRFKVGVKNPTDYQALKGAEHPVHFLPKKSSAMRRVLVPNLSATFHFPKTKFVHDIEIGL